MAFSPISPSFLVSCFLRLKNYPQTLAPFIQEAGSPEDMSQVSEREHSKREIWAIERIVQEYRTFDKVLSFGEEKAEAAEAERWMPPG